MINDDHIVMPRVNPDGYTMNKRAEELEKYCFKVEEVMDADQSLKFKNHT